jgi:hypothetical protein
MLYVDIPSRPEIEKLASSRAEPSVTIYVKTTPLTQEIGASRIALKNLAHQALEQLKAGGVDKRRLWPIEEVINHVVDDDAFWATQANSLAPITFPTRCMCRTASTSSRCCAPSPSRTALSFSCWARTA